jgi:hypothetical protein
VSRVIFSMYISMLMNISRPIPEDLEDLEDAVMKSRQILSHCPSGHPDRDIACTRLAISLKCMFEQCGDAPYLRESITLHKEALSLRPLGDTSRSESCLGLGESLYLYFESTGASDQHLLDEATALLREAMTLQQHSGTRRLRTIIALSRSLQKLSTCESSSDASVLSEGITLINNALNIEQANPSDRAELYLCLAAMLGQDSSHRDDLKRIIELCQKAAETFTSQHPLRWQALVALSRAHLEHSSSDDRVQISIQLLSEATALKGSKVSSLLFCEIASQLDLISLRNVPENLRGTLLDVYKATIGMLHRLTVVMQDWESQARHLSIGASLGPAACILACNIGRPTDGLQLLELTRGVGWSLRMRLPQIPKIPSMADAIRSGVFGHPVVILLALEDECHALIIQPNTNGLCDLTHHLLPDCKPSHLRKSGVGTRLFHSSDTIGIYRGLRIPADPSARFLRYLWLKVVQPILQELGLDVREVISLRCYSMLLI